jgi:hypothetical protein
MRTYIYIYIGGIYTYVYTYKHAHTRARAHTHTHTHTHMAMAWNSHHQNHAKCHTVSLVEIRKHDQQNSNVKKNGPFTLELQVPVFVPLH